MPAASQVVVRVTLDRQHPSIWGLWGPEFGHPTRGFFSTAIACCTERLERLAGRYSAAHIAVYLGLVGGLSRGSRSCLIHAAALGQCPDNRSAGTERYSLHGNGMVAHEHQPGGGQTPGDRLLLGWGAMLCLLLHSRQSPPGSPSKTQHTMHAVGSPLWHSPANACAPPPSLLLPRDM